MVTAGKERQVLRPAAEELFASELDAIKQSEEGMPRPNGWKLTPRGVRSFILGDKKLGVSQKFFGDDALVERAIVTLTGGQGLMLVGEPGTAKSMISELLATAISGSSRRTVQGSAGIIEDHLRYSWNYALLLAEGPSERAMVPSPVLGAMQAGSIVRIEEITRMVPEVQDVLISLLSEKTISVPELGADFEYRAQPGFGVIATANLRDKGVHEMSSALKRRFNFETVRPIADAEFEKELIGKQVQARLAETSIPENTQGINEDILDILVTVFRELRNGEAADGTRIERAKAVMSTAEAVNVAHAALLDAAWFEGKPVNAGHIAKQVQGVVFKDDENDAKVYRQYLDAIVNGRARKNDQWKRFMSEARAALGY